MHDHDDIDPQFSKSDFDSLLHPEGAPGQLAVLWGDAGAKAAVAQTNASAHALDALAARHSAVAVLWGVVSLLAFFLAIPAAVIVWQVAIG